jgi:hypothetical protein
MPALYPTRSQQIAARMLGSEMMIMSPVDATLFSLNEVGSVIWQAADGHTPLEEIVKLLCAEFEITAECARQDTESFLQELAAHGIMQMSDHPMTEPQ